MTQAQLASAAGVSLKTITNLETDGVTPQRGTLMKIREALGLPEDLDEAIAEAPQPSGLAAAFGGKYKMARPTRSGEERFFSELKARILNLEERVEELEARLLVAGNALFSNPVAEQPPRPSRTIDLAEVAEVDMEELPVRELGHKQRPARQD